MKYFFEISSIFLKLYANRTKSKMQLTKLDNDNLNI